MNDGNEKSHRQRGKSKKRFNIFHIVLISILLIIVIAVGAVGGYVLAAIRSAPPLNPDEFLTQSQSSIVYAPDPKNSGSYIQVANLHGDQNRLWVSINKIPDNLKNAFIATEDARFYKHHGIDFIRIMGAFVANIKAGDITQGGSTITQQLIKTVMLSPEKTLKRKIQEAYLAYQLENVYSKDQILEAYLNTIFLGSPNINVNGVEAASLIYFGKHVDQLDLAECAVIAGITKNPSRYSPYANEKNAKERQELVLKLMLEQGYITQDEYEKAINEKLEYKTAQWVTDYDHAYFVDQVINDVINDLQKKYNYSRDDAVKKVYNGGLKIYSTMDISVQENIEKSFENNDLFPQTKKDTNGALQPQGAMIIIDYHTGEIKGIVGGRGHEGKRLLNRATQSKRQPGSSIKPLTVYTPAIDNGYTTRSPIDDTPFVVHQKGGDWQVHNYENNYWGRISLREAIQYSRNIPAAKLVMALGVDTSVKYAESFGLDIDPEDRYPAPMALGGLTHGVSPLQMAAAYGALANGGVYITPHTYTKVVDKDGSVLLENKPDKHVVVSKQVAYIMTSLMRSVVSGGTGTGAQIPNMPVAGKTGTTSNYKDAWFVGYTPYYSAAVWMGYDQNEVLKAPNGRYVTGGSYPARLWKDVMTKVHEGLTSKEFDVPDGLTWVDVCKDSGELPTDLCARDPRGSRVVRDIFIKGTEPKGYCTVHQVATVDVTTGKLATEYCPPEDVQTKVFMNIPDRDPSLNTRDKAYILPEEYCDIHGPATQSPWPGQSEPPQNGVEAPGSGQTNGDTENNTPGSPQEENVNGNNAVTGALNQIRKFIDNNIDNNKEKRADKN
ncbi:transglycosylase domain-containing protein [Calorimonas adulescens]|uniref:Penicillin-binding protein 1A n=1 Tax=Calorimonas adulescens TaxID=2606906 RepID=A0A5D8QCZ2_9THEO|nr:penicillin-binding protein 1A [Calorimonas adulescens]TZE82277.1 penicillin-binding protein 1A [Calorimonas adulescens]